MENYLVFSYLSLVMICFLFLISFYSFLHSVLFQFFFVRIPDGDQRALSPVHNPFNQDISRLTWKIVCIAWNSSRDTRGPTDGQIFKQKTEMLIWQRLCIMRVVWLFHWEKWTTKKKYLFVQAILSAFSWHLFFFKFMKVLLAIWYIIKENLLIEGGPTFLIYQSRCCLSNQWEKVETFIPW